MILNQSNRGRLARAGGSAQVWENGSRTPPRRPERRRRGKQRDDVRSLVWGMPGNQTASVWKHEGGTAWRNKEKALSLPWNLCPPAGHIADMQRPGARQGKFQNQGRGGIWGTETGGFGHQAHRHSVFIPQGCNSKAPQTRRLTVTEGHHLTVLQARSPNAKCGQARAPSEPGMGEYFLASC